jgi:hypothetical protein
LNFGDVAEFRGQNVLYDRGGEVNVCVKYNGNAVGLETVQVGTGADGQNCVYDDSTISIRR